MRVKKGSHTVYKTQYHIVWITRFRRKILTSGVSDYLAIKFREIGKYYPDWEYIAIGMDNDHLHLHMVIPPKYAVSRVVNVLKTNTSKSLYSKFDFLKKVYWDKGGVWGKGFFVSTVGIDEETIRKYVEMQAKEDTGQAELEL